MNCRQGDLAVIVACPEVPENIGAIVEVLRRSSPCPCGCTELNICWLVKSQGRKLAGFGGYFNERTYVEESNVQDAYLRPIRDTDPDAVDEMVRSIGAAPMTLTEILQGEVSHG